MLVPENPCHLAMSLSPETCGKDTPKLRTSTTTLVSDKVFCSCNPHELHRLQPGYVEQLLVGELRISFHTTLNQIHTFEFLFF
jgi:hypothetical protein